MAIKLRGHASTQSPQPLHSSVSIRNRPRSGFSMVFIYYFLSRFASHSGIRDRQCFALEIMRAHCKIFKFLLKAGVGNRDQGKCAFAQSLAMQVSDAAVGHHVMHIGTRGNDSGTRLEDRHDAGDVAMHGCRLQSNDGHAAFGACGSANEVQLPAEAAVWACSEGIGADLSGEVYLEGRVDGDHAVVLRHDEGIVCVADRTELEAWVLADEVEQSLGSEHEAGHH